MTIAFKPAVRSNSHVIIGLSGPSGSGKTFSALRLARGLVGEAGRIGAIDTEARRMLHYADAFAFDHAEMAPPFRPTAYLEAIRAAEKAGYEAIIIDSMSHEWEGEGGILRWHEEELDRLAGDDRGRREAMKAVAWIKPKADQSMFLSHLLQVRAHLIMCFRAKEKIKLLKNDKGKTEFVPQGWQPIGDPQLPFEMTVSFMLSEEAPGLPSHPLKLQEQHKRYFPPDRTIDERAGQELALWASGKKAEKPPEAPIATSTDVSPRLLAVVGDDWRAWCARASELIREAPSADWLTEWLKLHGTTLLSLKQANERFYEEIMKRASDQRERCDASLY